MRIGSMSRTLRQNIGVNKLTVVHLANRNAKPSDMCVPLNSAIYTKPIKSAHIVFTLAVSSWTLSQSHLPCEAGEILHA